MTHPPLCSLPCTSSGRRRLELPAQAQPAPGPSFEARGARGDGLVLAIGVDGRARSFGKGSSGSSSRGGKRVWRQSRGVASPSTPERVIIAKPCSRASYSPKHSRPAHLGRDVRLRLLGEAQPAPAPALPRERELRGPSAPKPASPRLCRGRGPPTVPVSGPASCRVPTGYAL